jgi:hypothetical protein
LGNAKIPTDLKPYWSRAGLRHPDLVVKHRLRWHMRRDGMRRADMSWDERRWSMGVKWKCKVWSLEPQVWHLEERTAVAQSAHALAWLAHSARKFYRWKRFYSITLRQLPPRLVRVLLITFFLCTHKRAL